MKKNLLLVLTLCLLSFQGISQEFTLTGEVNARPEFRNGFKKPILDGQDPAFFTEQRTRLYFNLKDDKYEVQITLQDVRTWGATRQIYKEDNAMFGVVDAWGKYKFTETFAFKAGRQMISYDNQRYFGGLEWAMQGRRHDALLFLYEKEGLKLHFGGAFNQTQTPFEYAHLTGRDYLGVANYKHMEYAYLNKKWEKDASISLYLVNIASQYGATSDSVASKQTLGLMGMKKLGDLTLNGEFFYQMGDINATTELSAMMFSLSGTYKTKVTPITLGYDYLSGTDSGSDKAGSWNPDFGTNHAFYGFMDYFYVGNGNSNAGLQDFYLKTKFKVAGGALLGHVHYFLAAADQDAYTDKALGTEIDLVYVKKFAPAVTWKLGYSQMFGTDTMDIIKGTPDSSSYQSWAWTQIIFKPQLFKSTAKKESKS
ncbi:MAG: hypothetical protein JXR07_16490 [Reichenbachiella sp.]